MGKPLELIRGEHYVIARCPKTNEILDAIHDTTHGAGVPSSGEWIVACPDCGSHSFDLAKVRSELFA
jgi:4-hydroxy-3-methylbut-2-en-1-yl diphosphate synthase IspG/GcpE